jgi:hypothetical protein
MSDFTASPRTTRSGACSSCGAYGASQHRPTCEPGRRFGIGHMRVARRDSRTSAIALAHQRLQQSLARDL